MDIAVEKGVSSELPVFEKVESLYDKSLFRQAFELAEAHWGKIDTWLDSKQIILGARILSQLGLNRKCFALFLKAWRKDKNSPEVIYYYVRYLLSRKGPLEALKCIKKIQLEIFTESKQKAEWLSLNAWVYAQYRDWDSAWDFMEQAESLSPDNEWLIIERAYLLELEDKYDLALIEINKIEAESNYYRASVFCKTNLLYIQNDKIEALTLLEKFANESESVNAYLQLFRWQVNEKQSEKAQHCIDQARDLLGDKGQLISEEFSIASFETLYDKGEYNAAEKALHKVRSAYYRKIKDNLEQARTSNMGTFERTLLDVPFVRQHHMTCAPATLTAITSFWGQAADHIDIVEKICYDGTPNHAERQWAKENGWETIEFDLHTDIAIQLIDKGIPFTLSTVEPGSAHLQAVIGYDLRKRVFLIRDPFYPSINEMLMDETGEHYRSSGPRCLAILPKHKLPEVSECEFPEQPFYDDYFELQTLLSEHKRSEALKLVHKMSEKNAKHRLTLCAWRTLARYDSDIVSELKNIDALLMTYPEDLNLQGSRSYLLGRLGRRSEQLNYLEELCDSPSVHPYIMQELAEVLRSDHRNQQKTAKLLDYVLRRQPTNAYALWILASLKWDQQQFEEACELYRLCACLEDKNESYFESYFKAAQYLKKTDTALTLLESRIQSNGKQSPEPYISMYHARSMLSQYKESIDILEQAKILHANSPRLIHWLARAYLDNAMSGEAEQLINEAKGKLKHTEWLNLAARLENLKGNWLAEKKFYSEILESEPLNHEAINSIASLLGHHESDDAAIKFLDGCLEINPDELDLHLQKNQWLQTSPSEERLLALQTLLAKHSNNEEVLLLNARYYFEQKDFEQTMHFANKALAVNSCSREALIQIGDVYCYRNELSEARRFYRQAIQLFVDHSGAFAHLLRACNSIEEKREELAFIYDELIRQTSFGNGIFEYRSEAKAIVNKEEMVSFLELAWEQRPDLWHSWVALAMEYKDLDRLEDAEALLHKGIEKFPLVPNLYFELSILYMAMQEPQKAEEAALQALEQSPRWISAILQLADVYEARNKQNELLELIEKALELNPGQFNLLGYLADVKLRASDLVSARTYLEKALSNNFGYGWGWEKLQEVSKSLGQPSIVSDLIESLLTRSPKNAWLWKVRGDYTNNSEQQFAYLQQALEYSPRNVDINLAMCRALYDAQKLAELSRFIHHEKWQGNPHEDLLVFEAWVDAQLHRYPEALSKLRSVVERYPNCIDALRLLSYWSRITGDHENAITWANRYAAMNPHNMDILSFVAETYLAASHDGLKIDKTLVQTKLEKSVLLNPSNLYNALTLLDFLIEENDLSSLSKAFDLINIEDAESLFLARKLHYKLMQEELETALAIVSKMLFDKKANTWVFDTMYANFLKHGKASELFKLVSSHLDNVNVSPFIGRCWMQHLIDSREKDKSIVKSLESLSGNQPIWIEAIEKAMEPRYYGKLSHKIIEKFGDRLRSHARLWALVTFFYADIAQWSRLTNWCREHWKRNENEAWAVYLYGLGLRLLKNWKKAAEVNDYALTLPNDDYYDRIYMWHELDSALNQGKSIDRDKFYLIRQDELSKLEVYAYGLLKILLKLNDYEFEGHYSNYKNLLMSVKRNNPEILASKPAQILKLKVRHHISKTIQGSFWHKLIWKWRLFNLM